MCLFAVCRNLGRLLKERRNAIEPFSRIALDGDHFDAQFATYKAAIRYRVISHPNLNSPLQLPRFVGVLRICHCDGDVEYMVEL
jgi:hypothetical protein